MEEDLSGSSDANACCSQKFPEESTAALERLYSGGMTGWGKDHSEIIGIAMTSTSLALPTLYLPFMWGRGGGGGRKGFGDSSINELSRLRNNHYFALE